MWSSEWSKDQCQLVDWLTFPGPFFAPDGTRLKKGDKVSVHLASLAESHYQQGLAELVGTGAG